MRQELPERRRVSPRLLAVVLLVLLVAVAVFVVRQIGGASQLQDCVMQGRTNCAPLR
jgi:hypothetical protein